MTPELTNALSIDCERVLGSNGKELLAQVALCNEYNQCVYNYYVKQQNVADYRTRITGITPNHLRSGKYYQVVRQEVADLIRGRILVGHSMHHDLRALGLGHPEWNQRDTAVYFYTNRRFPSLKYLARQHLGWTIQQWRHNAVEDARATMAIYKMFEDEWEEETESDSSSTEYYDSSSSDY